MTKLALCTPLSLPSTYPAVLLHGTAPSRGLAGPADVVRSTSLILGLIVCAGVVWDTIAEDPGVGGGRVPTLATVGLVGLETELNVLQHWTTTHARMHARTHARTHTHTHHSYTAGTHSDAVDEHLGREVDVREGLVPHHLDPVTQSRRGPHGPTGTTVCSQRGRGGEGRGQGYN